MYYDFIYLSPCEAVWRIFSFDVHFREPTVERLPLHLPDEQIVVFGDDDPIESIMERPNIHKSKFLSWTEENKKYPETKDLTYAQFPMKFVWKQPLHEWFPRKKRVRNRQTLLCTSRKWRIILFEDFVEYIKRSYLFC